MANAWLSYANLSDSYDRRARFLPAVLSILLLLPASVALGGPLVDWVAVVLGGVGIGGAVAVGLSHLASAMGNRFQDKLWPRWPHDSPTNRWLHPDETRTSPQQRALWYRSVQRLVGMNIGGAIESGRDVEATINDAVSALRNLFWGRPEARRLQLHNTDYGFARNFTGMRPIWVGFLLVSAGVCWINYFAFDRSALLWAVVSTLLALVLIPIAFLVLPGYVQTKAIYYAETFFGTLSAVDEAWGTD